VAEFMVSPTQGNCSVVKSSGKKADSREGIQ